MRKGAIACGVVVLLLSVRLAAAQRLNVYMYKGGAGAVSMLQKAEWRDIFAKRIFADHDATIDLTSGKRQFLERLLASDLVYVSAHRRESTGGIVLADEQELSAGELAIAFKAHGMEGPRLVVAAACETIRSGSDSCDYAASLGIGPGIPGRAYVGFDKNVVGRDADKLFRMFFATWLRRKPDGSYRTLEQARRDAKATMERLHEAQAGAARTRTGRHITVSDEQIALADRVRIIGDSSLTVADVQR